MVYHGRTTVYHVCHGIPWYTMYTMVYHGIHGLHYGIAEELIQLKCTITYYYYYHAIFSVCHLVSHLSAAVSCHDI